MIQSLLPTRERLFRIGRVQSPSCFFCNHQDDTLIHLLSCQQATEVTTPLLACIQSQDRSVTPVDIISLNIVTSEAMELPIAWLIATCLQHTWEARLGGKVAKLEQLRAELLARLSLLKLAKWKHYALHNSSVLLDEMINLHFN